MTNFVKNNFYFFTDEDYALLIREYNEIIHRNFKSAINNNISST